MARIFLLLFFFSLFLNSKELKFKPQDSQLAEITANKVQRKGDEVIAQGNVILISGDYYISTQDLIYNQKTKIAHIDGEARIYQGNDLLLTAKKIRIDFGQNNFSLSSLYLQNNHTGLWVSANEAHSKNQVYYFGEGVISGCDIQMPIWHLDVSSGSFDQNNGNLVLWNARAYLGKMPFLYFPYISFSTSNQRKSGLLYPNLAYYDREGFYYEQPIYIAPQESWDMTLSPQIRSLRGAGISGEFRLATPRDNLFLFRTKYFYNFDSYFRRYDLKNQHIYGFDLFYKTHNGIGITQKFPTLYDGLFFDFSYMNDIDYLRIDDAQKKINDRLRVSKAYYFLRSQDHYLGIYNQYFFDFTSLDGQETFQLLPSIQYHKFFDSLFWKNLMYSLDFQTSNVTRPKGYGYIENIITLPLGLTLPLFNDYVTLGLATDLNFTNINFYRSKDMIVPGGVQPQKSANFFTANYIATLTSDIAKDYGSFLHTAQIEAKVAGPYYRYNTEMFDSKVYRAYSKEVNQTHLIHNLWNPLSIVDFDANQQTFEVKLSQYFYLPNGKTAFYYNVAQKLNLEIRELLFASSMQNEIGTSPIDGLDLKGKLYYSFLYNAIESASVNLDFSGWRLNGSFGYYYKNVFTSTNLNTDANFLNFALKSDLGYFTFGGDINYDFVNTQVKDWSLVLATNIRCFGISFKFGQEFTPMITDRPNHPIETIVNNYIKVEFQAIPLGAVGASYRFKK